MTDKSKRLSDTARSLLTSASTRDDHLIRPPQLPTAAARQVIRSLLNAGLAEEVPAPIEDAAYAWRRDEDDIVLMLRATVLGLVRVGEREGVMPEVASDPMMNQTMADVTATTSMDADKAATAVARSTQDFPVSGVASDLDADNGSAGRVGPQDNLPRAAQALLDAWGELADSDNAIIGALSGPVDELRAALEASSSASRPIGGQRPHRDTKQAQVLAMLCRDEGASGPQIAEAMNWAPHTVRGFLAGLAKKGITVGVLDRVREVGPNKAGAKGSYTVYRVASEASK